jgi:ribonucleoside-diphosphate reductase alpha chain
MMIWNTLVKQFLMFCFFPRLPVVLVFLLLNFAPRVLFFLLTILLSSGPIPFLHIIDSAVRAVQRGGKKKGALCFYMENWHLNFQDFIDLKQNAGDDYRRARTANTAVFISDEFMRRVKAGEDWYLFDPNEVKDLNELYGDAFAKRYNEYCAMADNGQIKQHYSKLPATQQYKNILSFS